MVCPTPGNNYSSLIKYLQVHLSFMRKSLPDRLEVSIENRWVLEELFERRGVNNEKVLKLLEAVGGYQFNGEGTMMLTNELKGLLCRLLKPLIESLDQSGIGRTLQKEEMDRVKSKWNFLIQCRPNVKCLVGNAKLIGGHINYDDNHDEIFSFITAVGTFFYNERTHEFKS